MDHSVPSRPTLLQAKGHTQYRYFYVTFDGHGWSWPAVLKTPILHEWDCVLSWPGMVGTGTYTCSSCELTMRDGHLECDICLDNLRVFLKGNVSLEHVVEEDAQRPHCGRYCMVAMLGQPLGRTIDTCSWGNKNRNFTEVQQYTL